MIAFLLEDNAPIAVPRLPDNPFDAAIVLAQFGKAGVEIAKLAQSQCARCKSPKWRSEELDA